MSVVDNNKDICNCHTRDFETYMTNKDYFEELIKNKYNENKKYSIKIGSIEGDPLDLCKILVSGLVIFGYYRTIC